MVKFNSINYKDLKVIERKDPGTRETIALDYEEYEVQMNLKQYIKDQIPSVRFWLMLKLKNPDRWTKRWNDYLAEVHDFLVEHFQGERDQVEFQIRQAIEKLERSAWNTMPSSFLSTVGIPRVIRR